jgi:hypothetical protein
MLVTRCCGCDFEVDREAEFAMRPHHSVRVNMEQSRWNVIVAHECLKTRSPVSIPGLSFRKLQDSGATRKRGD